MEEYKSISSIAKTLKSTRFTIRAAIRRAKRNGYIVRQLKLPYHNYVMYNINDIIYCLFNIKWRVLTQSEQDELTKILGFDIQECLSKAKKEHEKEHGKEHGK